MPPEPLDPPIASPVSRDDAVRARQRSRAIVTAVMLFALVILFYAISIAKML